MDKEVGEQAEDRLREMEEYYVAFGNPPLVKKTVNEACHCQGH